MYTGLLHTHSAIRYVILILLIAVIIQSLLGLINKKPYTSLDNRVGLFLFIFTHLQLLIGLILYVVSYTSNKRVQFNSETMSNAALRYFAVEHVISMLIAVVLITIARAGMKKLTNDHAKHKRMFTLNTIALLIIMVMIYIVGRPYNSL